MELLVRGEHVLDQACHFGLFVTAKTAEQTNDDERVVVAEEPFQLGP